jgi:hypothetical protein
MGSVLLSLFAAVVHKNAGRPQTSVQDRVDQAEVDGRMAELTQPRFWRGTRQVPFWA